MRLLYRTVLGGLVVCLTACGSTDGRRLGGAIAEEDIGVRRCPGPDFAVLVLDTLFSGQEYPLVMFACDLYPRPLQWTFAAIDTTIATVRAQSDSTATIQARNVGSTELVAETSQVPARLSRTIHVRAAP